MRSVAKKIMHWAGGALAIAGVGFVTLRLYDYGLQIDVDRLNGSLWFAVAGFALINALANIMLALAWWNLLRGLEAFTTWHWAIKAYGISQLAKYVPGNVFHLAGRQALGMTEGLSGWSLAKTSIWELGLILAAGGIFGLLILPLLVPGFSQELSVVLFVVIASISTGLLWGFIGSSFAYAFGWYMGFFIVSASLFVGLIELLINSSESGILYWIPLGGACVVAWLVGLITPGAPAGAGVRELTLLFLLGEQIMQADLLLAVVLGRVVTMAGDFLFFAASALKYRRNHF